MPNPRKKSLVLPITPAFIERRIHLIRGQKVLFDTDLAELYQVSTKRLNEQVKRNIRRFPSDFMFRLDLKEIKYLNRSQFATSYQKHRDPRFRPYVFSELGVAMLSSVLNSEHAVQMNIFIMRAFVKLRELLATHRELADKIENLEKRQKDHSANLFELNVIIEKLIRREKYPKNAVGFVAD